MKIDVINEKIRKVILFFISGINGLLPIIILCSVFLRFLLKNIFDKRIVDKI